MTFRLIPKKPISFYFQPNRKKRALVNSGTSLPSVCLGEDFIVQSETVDYLGARLDGSLSWDHHIEKLSAILSSNNFVLRNISILNNIHLSRTVYFSLIESHIRYSIMFWGLSSKQNLDKIFLIQKRSIRSILRLKPSDSCFDHFAVLGIMTVPSLYMYEVISYIVDHKFFPAHTHSYNTRNRQLNPSVQHRLKIFEQKPEYIGLKLFSKLPENLQILKDKPKTFKAKLKEFLIEKRYYEVPYYNAG